MKYRAEKAEAELQRRVKALEGRAREAEAAVGHGEVLKLPR